MEPRPTYDELERQVKALQIENNEICRVKQSIESSEALHRLALENISDTVVITDDHGKIIYVCPNVDKISGLSQNQVYAKGTIQELINGNACDLSELKKIKEIPNIEWIVVDSSGRKRTVLITLKSVSIEDGTVLYVMRDITERKQAEESHRLALIQFNALFHKAAVPLCFVNKVTSTLKFNKQFEKVFGWRSDDISNLEEWWLLAYPDPKYRKWVIDSCYSEIKRATETNTDIKPIEYDVTCKNGDIRKMVVYGSFIGDDLLITFFDITERKQAEIKIKENEERFKLAMEFANDGLFDWNLVTNEIYYSTVWKRILGYEDHELPNDFTVWEDLTKPEDVKRSWEMQNDLINRKRDRFEIEFKMKHKDGHWVDILSRANAIFDNDGKAIRIVGTHVDISERVKSQKELEKEKDKFQSYMKYLPGVAYIKDNLGRYVYLNETFETTFQTKLELWQGKTDSELKFFPDEIIDELVKNDNQVLNTNQPLRIVEHVPVGDQLHHWLAIKFPISGRNDKETFLAGIAIDITNRISIEDALKESEKRFRLAFENANDGVCLVEISGKIAKVNKRMCEIFGYSKTELESMTVHEIAYPEDKELSTKFIQKSVKGETDSFVFEKRYLHQNGSVVFGQVSSSVIKNEEGEPLYFISHVQDITKKKKAEAERERLLSAIEQVGEMVVITDSSGIIQYVNPAFTDTTGYSKQESIGQNPRFLKSGKHDRSFYKSLWDTILSGNQWSGRLVNRRKDGSLYTTECSISTVKNQENVIQNFVWISSDITEKMELEKRVQHGQQLESIGNLAGGIAHDFNNILSSIIGFTELALDDSEKGTNIEDNLQEVYAAGKRAKDLVSQILAFARQSEKEIKPIRVDTVVEEVLQFIRSSIPTTIKIRKHIDSKSLILGNQTQVHQIMMNLCTNAEYAMEDKGGILEVSLKDILIKKGSEKNILGLKPKNYIEIKVSDTGVGMTPDTLRSIFKPYFTTKGPGEGTGMGLAMVYGIVESYGGKIYVDSKLGKGSVFKIYLPVTRKRRDHRSYELTELPSGTERILLVDDEVSIVKMGCQILDRLGYSVTVRTSSLEALELFQAKPNDFDIVVTDMTMPNMTGDRLAVELMKIRPDIPVILCTGYSKKISDETASKIGIKAFAYKPVAKADLATTVRKVLDEATKSEK